MRILPTLRSFGRAALGLRPLQRDLDRLISSMRERLQRGQPLRTFKPPRVSPQTALRYLRAFQLRKLKKTVAYAYQYVPYYRRTLDAVGVHPRDIRSWDDLRRLPITHRTDLQLHRDDFISRAPGHSATVSLRTSGTTGKPIECFLNDDEFQYYASMQAIASMAAGFLGPSHIIQVHLPLERSISAQLSTAAAQMSGALVMNFGLAGSLDEHLESIFQERNIPGKFSKVSGLYAAPGYLWALTARAEQLGIDCSRSGLRRIFTCGAMVSKELKERVLAVWGLSLREAYSMIETVSTGIFECERGRLHFLDVTGILELLDPKTSQPVSNGAPGIAVMTTFYPDRELMPVLRYWSDDLMKPASEAFCPCGNPATMVEAILGRADQMITVGGQNFYPQPIGDALTAFRELVQPPRFQVRTEDRTDAQYVLLDVENVEPLESPAKQALIGRIRKALPFESARYIVAGVVKWEVNLLPGGSIQCPFQYKLQGPAPKSGI